MNPILIVLFLVVAFLLIASMLAERLESAGAPSRAVQSLAGIGTDVTPV